MSLDLDLAGKRALVTGGTKGIGVATVGILTRARARVVTTARSLPSAPVPGVHFLAADITQPGDAPPLRKAFSIISAASI